jgi:hypothetical protein
VAFQEDNSESDLSMRCCLGVVDRVRFSQQVELLRCRATGKTQLLPVAISQSLGECGSFERLSDLAKRAYGRVFLNQKATSRSFDQARTANARSSKGLGGISQMVEKWQDTLARHDSRFYDLLSELRALVEAGILIPESDLIDSLRRTVPEEKATKRIRTLGVVTKDRPQSLLQCLASYLECAQSKWKRPIEVAIMDGSSDQGAIESNRSLLAQLARLHGVPIWYAGRPEKTRFATLLSHHGGIRKEIIDFALFGLSSWNWTPGANRNALILDSVGEQILSVDDDTICRPVETHAPKPGLRLGCQAEPQEFWFFSDRQEALAFAPESEIDIFAAHEDLLGRLPSRIFQTSSADEIYLQSLCEPLLETLQSGLGHVVMTNNGLLGDCALSSSFTVLVHRGSGTRERLFQSRSDYDLGLRTREVLRVASSPYIIHGPPWVGAVMGLDISGLLPPFVPVGYGEDVLFGFTITKCIPHAYFGHLPYALVHAPQTPREYLHSYLATAKELRIDDIIGAAMSSFQPRPGRDSADCRLKDLGNYLADLSKLTDLAFRKEIITCLLMQERELIANLESWLAEGDGPSYWRNDVRSWLDRRARAWANSESLSPSDVPCGVTASDGWAITKTIMRQYAEVLLEWPEIISATRHLREKGIRVSRLIGKE